jgi:hypothetical protein
LVWEHESQGVALGYHVYALSARDRRRAIDEVVEFLKSP